MIETGSAELSVHIRERIEEQHQGHTLLVLPNILDGNLRYRCLECEETLSMPVPQRTK